MPLDFRALPILYVDGDAASAARFREILGEQFSVTTAHSGAQALHALELTEVAVLVAENGLPDMTATDLFEQLRLLRPEVMRLLTATELSPESAEAAINRGRVSGYMAKPWQAERLREWLTATLETLLRESNLRSMEMSLWHGGQVAAATTVYEELVHELSNPLGALEINASLVADLLSEITEQGGAVLDMEAVRAAAATACEAHTDSLAAIDQMKSLVSRMRHGGMSRPRTQGRCDPGRVIEATVRVVRAEVEKVAQLEVRVAAAPTVQMDASVLGQVLLNLLLNAAQAFPAHKRAENRIQVLASLAPTSTAEQLLISVRDNGPGIVAGLHERVFEPFFTTKENGTGLGLAICRELVTRAHGSISVENLRGGGAQFDIRLPLAK